MRKSLLASLLLLLAPTLSRAAADVPPADSAGGRVGRQLRSPLLNTLYQFVKEFSRVDTAYVEPQKYNFTVMLQNTNTYEVYHLRSKEGQEVVFSPRPSYKVGPYVGWRWVFLGYTFELAHAGGSSGRNFNLSLYSSQIGADLFYRKSGDNYRVSRLDLGKDYDTKAMHNMEFDGFDSSIRGFNLYYIFNHRKFSYPAAYSQSTIQRRSAGSPMAGFGYTRHTLDIDWEAFRWLTTYMVGEKAAMAIDTTLHRSNVTYSDYSLSGGYAYNWVFAHNWLFDISLQLDLSYKKTISQVTQKESYQLFRDFDFRNLNLDGIARMGVIWNNMRWYVGANAIFHAYNYRKSQFSTNNVFGSVNFYAGFNFGKR